jgi:TPR repeat protein
MSASWAAAHFYYTPALSNSQAGVQSIEPVANGAQQNPVQEKALSDTALKGSALRQSYDQEVDRALQFSLEGKYYESANILIPLAKKGYDRAQLYLAVAYYHGHGVDRDKKKAEQLFFELQRKNFEPGIVHTYLNLLGSLPPA